jgi:hypothetical protein
LNRQEQTNGSFRGIPDLQKYTPDGSNASEPEIEFPTRQTITTIGGWRGLRAQAALAV